MLFNIWVTEKCNFACHYCYEGEHDNNIHMDKNMADEIVTFLERIFLKYSSISTKDITVK